ncbi:carotenoid oxygenase family protein [Pandoraea pnomenusa]|uniref:carotenoid oxygenase family protein n=1 Tax=Pandoraea pnomenusa TaxID=93220 RepID=UPI003342AF65
MDKAALDVIGVIRSAGRPSRTEFDIERISVEGALPETLDGTFYRVLSDRQFPAHLGPDFPFNEDGMVWALRLKDGKASIKQRYVQTDRWKLENEHGRSLFGRYRDPYSDEPETAGVERTLANTAPLVHAGVLLAMKEDGPAYGLDPVTLETHGIWDFHGTFRKRVIAAHARVDSEGRMHAFGYADDGLFARDITYYEISPEGRIVHEVAFELPYMNMQHDVCISDDYVIWAVSPLVGVGDEKLREGERFFAWESTLPLYLCVLPRGGAPEDVRWFKSNNRFISHNLNASNIGSTITFDTCTSAGNAFPFFPELGKPFDPTQSKTYLTRITIDYERGAKHWSDAPEFLSEERLSDFVGEFPRIDDRFSGKAVKNGWMLRFEGTRNAFAHVDLSSRKTTVHEVPAHVVMQEPVFIPRTPNASEGDGYVAVVMNDTVRNLTDIAFFEATDVAKGPVCTLKLPLQIRSGWHGWWADVSETTKSISAPAAA